ncbi:MAG: DUF2256 domain-containing protein [Candidatus Pacebacteria bacterium]|nr:DUF2256 domain-containing protein [Candidatus Paceibacterota bacterium]MCD8507923.1 DUF2256 domain-containing protein [Candidatus Paceibacterota bacterium]MCD8528275.1 DUF2256 domain-containing protein [Candidatus Paceibacterota bacterium]MCD8563964.1 DUF2256 domain-containing protein [Candidatus Paceibacterota bacterium]
MTKKYREEKICLHCKRPFHNRKKWASRNMWDRIMYCGEACRKGRYPITPAS